MSQPYVGELRHFGFNFNPVGWARCEGQLLPIAQYDTLFNLIGTTYGGDGETTFALPDLRGRAPLSAGQGPGLAGYPQGELGGQETVTLNTTQLPAHSHSAGAKGSPTATSKSPDGAAPAVRATGASYGTAADLAMTPNTIGNSGGGQAHENCQPYLVSSWCIAVEGSYPSPS